MELVPFSSSSNFHELSVPCEQLPVHTLVSITQKELTRLKWEGSYWKAQHQRACAREALLKKELEEKEAQICDLKQRLFGKKSEKAKSAEKQATSEATRSRGQQRGRHGHGRTQRPDLPVVTEQIELPPDSCRCSNCGLPFAPFPGDEESTVIEIEVRAYKRKYIRKRYKKVCSCPETPKIIVAPLPPKPIPKCSIAVSVWVEILLVKYLYAQPLHRTLRQLTGFGQLVAQGTVTGGLQKLLPLFLPLYHALYEHQMGESLFHADESRWMVFVKTLGKIGHRWYLWLFRSRHVIYYRIEPTRSAAIPIDHFSNLVGDKIILVVDRFSSYKKLSRVLAKMATPKQIVLAFCWAHERRDFIELARDYPQFKDWAQNWIYEIGTLYHLNKQRLVHWEEILPLEGQNALFQEQHALLEKQLLQMKERCDSLLQTNQASQNEPDQTVTFPVELHTAQQKVLSSLKNHWKGLIVFLTHPEVPMDNNLGEQAIRNPVCGRKNYYGSGSDWSAKLTAVLFSLFQTLSLWNINTRHWLQQYLLACAHNDGAAPKDLTPFLPWSMSEERRQELSKPLPMDTS